MKHVTGIKWLNGTSNEHNTPLSATNLNSINKDTETALNAIIDDVANNVTTINKNMENKSYIKKYSGDTVVSGVVCGTDDVTVIGKDLKVDKGKSVFTDYLSSKNNQNGVVNGTVSNATNVTGSIRNIPIVGSEGIFENDGITAKKATSALNAIKNSDDTYSGLRRNSSSNVLGIVDSAGITSGTLMTLGSVLMVNETTGEFKKPDNSYFKGGTKFLLSYAYRDPSDPFRTLAKEYKIIETNSSGDTVLELNPILGFTSNSGITFYKARVVISRTSNVSDTTIINKITVEGSNYLFGLPTKINGDWVLGTAVGGSSGANIANFSLREVVF